MRTSPADKEIPDVVYKYRPPDDRSIHILLDRRLFCGPPRGLNDPLDCQFDMKAEVNRALVRIASRLGEDSERLRRLRTIRVALLRSVATNNPRSGAPMTFIELHQEQLAETGVLCFSEEADIGSLWAHYAANHTGFTLGFDPTRLVRDPPDEAAKSDFGEGAAVLTRVSYGAEDPFDGPLAEFVWGEGVYRTIDSEDLQIALAVSRTTVESLFAKTQAWSYEKEVRLIWSSRCGLFPFSNTSLRSIVYGLRIDPRTRSRLEEILAQPEWSHVRQRHIVLSTTRIGMELHDCH